MFLFRIHHNCLGQVLTPLKKETDKHKLEGQHISFYRGGYCHHAIVEKVTENAVHTIEYNLKVMRRQYDIKNDFYLVIPDKFKTCNEDEIKNIMLKSKERAKEALAIQDKYNPLYKNCEHFANHCVLGEAGSGQSVQYWRMLVLLIGRLLVEICLFLFKFGMITLLAKARPIAGDIDESTITWGLILKLLLASVLEFCFVVYDIYEGIRRTKHTNGCWSKKLCSAVSIRVVLALSSLGFMMLFSWLALRDLDINHAGIVLLAGSFGTLLGYGFVILIVSCICNNDVDSHEEVQESIEEDELNIEETRNINNIKTESFIWITKPRGPFNVSCIFGLLVLLDLTSFCFNSATYVRESWWNVPVNGKTVLYDVISLQIHLYVTYYHPLRIHTCRIQRCHEIIGLN